MTNEVFAKIAVRWIALLMGGVGTIWLVGNVLETAWDFNPNYLGYYAATQLLRPSLLLLLGLGLYGFSRHIARILCKD